LETAIFAPQVGFQCDLCGKIFKGKKNIRQHVVTHSQSHKPIKRRRIKKEVKKIEIQTGVDLKYSSDPNSVSCNICGKFFKSNRNLRYHEIVHTSDKNLKCQLCPKMFKRSGDLNRHVREHDGLRFECGLCLGTFKRRDYLKQHQQKCHPLWNTICSKELWYLKISQIKFDFYCLLVLFSFKVHSWFLDLKQARAYLWCVTSMIYLTAKKLFPRTANLYGPSIYSLDFYFSLIIHKFHQFQWTNWCVRNNPQLLNWIELFFF
jgi:uncharacterized C2H2 Zn-finger protein